MFYPLSTLPLKSIIVACTTLFVILGLFLLPSYAAESVRGVDGEVERVSMITHPGAIFAIVVFFLSYLAVLFEEKTHLRKSKPVLLGAGIIWVTIGIIAPDFGITHDQIHSAVLHGLEEYASLMLFLLAAMTYIAAMEERNVFAALRTKLVGAGMNMRQLFWATGVFAFCLSPVADNLTTALVLGAVVMAVGMNDPKFVAIACINIVNAANAGGAFSPFGDITTLMVWQAGHIEFFDFFPLFFPALICFLVPAIIMSFFIVPHKPMAITDKIKMKRGAKTIIALGICTITMAVSFEQFLGLPPFMGMMTGMALLMITAFFIRKVGASADKDFDVLELVANAEWDTLLFFFGVIFSVGGLTYLGYLELLSSTMYGGYGATITNIAMGFASAIIDNIPVMFAILSMNPDMDQFQWLLVTLTCGVGGSMLSIGSAAGVALMGVARGKYTFFGHLKWAPVILLGYGAAIVVHFLVNSKLIGVE
ncbi:MAG: sodium:proton antiporter [Alphaproteobacteria bacterium]|nr:sodium:proton antiporter [Alphaproteobacteria bacterium]NCQ88242.1 sodium:proton antiporter [Alphaproteobacteria bacterium]NCT05251.1 sodium:proton antiporter [Alphaproteobacteria bacterium]